MKRNMNATRELSNILLAIYGANNSQRAIHAQIETIEYDRYGTRVDVTIIDGTHIVGRLSLKHNFNGKTTKNDMCKTYRSYRA
jgi:hypothetical protein